MNGFVRGRTAMCGGAIVLALGAGMVVVPAAGAVTPAAGTGLSTGGLGGAGSTLSSTAAALAPTTSTTTTTTAGVVAGAAGAAGSTAGAVTGGAAAPIVSTQSNGSTTTISAVNGADGSLVTVGLGAPSGSGSGGTTGTTATVGGTAADAATGAVSGLLGGQGDGSATDGTGTGTGTAGGTGTTGSGGGTVHVDVQVGGNGQGGVTAPVALPSALPSAAPTTVDVETSPTPTAVPSVATPAVPAGLPAAPATESAAPVTSSSTPSAPVSTTAVPTALPVPTAAPSAAPAATAVRARLLSLRATPSLDTIYPVKDGYRDDVVFRLAAATSTGGNLAVEGEAVLRRGARTVAHWTIGRSTQDLRWSGLVGGKVVSGAYALTATLTDGAGGVHTATTKVAVSAKKLVPATTRLTAFALSGKHAMAAAPRAGLSKGAVTARIVTVATKVVGKQSLIFEKDGVRIVIPIKAGTRTSRLITVPRSFSSFTIRHTWKKGQVVLKSLQTTYSYQTLR